jgi:glutamyl-tRNA(Gln) amidotransferase subunit E
MKQKFHPKKNYEATRKQIGYVSLKDATQEDYNRIGFMSGLEVHQQLLTKHKLFCKCPAGIYHQNNDFDAELVRHMRPTLSELGEYDGTALMEFKTKKEIIYRVKNETTCTYEVDDTPPFPLNNEALDISILISLLSKLNIVGEVHVTRKQYLDGSIPTGFQRTAIIGVEGEIELKHKKIRLIQLSLEEDSCREISDIGHVRTYKTDRLGMPLIETVTYPDCVNPYEVQEACDYIRFLNRSTNMVRTGIGAGRQDVNVSCRGGSRVEIKGVSHTKWIPLLTHNECFRQWALLTIKEQLSKRIKEKEKWSIKHEFLKYHSYDFTYDPIGQARKSGYKIVALNLPQFKGILSHFTQPGKIFADEISDRLKVIACIEKPNLTHTEEFDPVVSAKDFNQIRELFKAGENDAQLIIWGPEEDIATALETIQERCRMAMEGVPNETRKSLEDGTTIFERVLPGADRMYPDTDTAPIPISEERIGHLGNNLPTDVIERYQIMKKWGIPEETYTYIFKKNLFPTIQHIVDELKIDPVFTGTFLGYKMKFVEGHHKTTPGFNHDTIYALFKFLKNNDLDIELANKMISEVYEHPKMEFESVLTTIGFRNIPKTEILAKITFLKEKFDKIKISDNPENGVNWAMGQLRSSALGNISLKELAAEVRKIFLNHNQEK